jgi:hypothetical protein
MTTISNKEPRIRINGLYLSSFEEEEYRIIKEFIKKHYNNTQIPLKEVINNCIVLLVCEIINIFQSIGIPKSQCIPINRIVYVLFDYIEKDINIINKCINQHLIKNVYTNGRVVLSK